MKTFIIVLTLAAMAMGVAINEADYHSIEHLMGQRRPAAANDRFFEELGGGKHAPEEEKNPEFWNSLAREELAKRLDEQYNFNKAKNVIFFLGDGMSLTTVTASRIRKGQLKGKTGEEEKLSFERFPHTGLSRTYCANAQVADSACTATAYLCGVKSNIVTIGVSPNVEYNNCSMSMDPENHVSSIASWAQKAGKSTGFITTTTLTHASPSGSYAHTANRFWECDADIQAWGDHNEASSCMDIAQQLIKQAPGRDLDLMMGGGMGKFLPNTMNDAHGKKGEREDGRNLLSLWSEMHPTGKLVTNRDELLNLNVDKAGKIMGIFGSGVMNYHALADNNKQPTLAEMTEVALKFLSKNDKGYFIFIEGGLIDYGNHANKPGLSLDETLEMEKAIELAVNMTDPNETLIVVSADHAHPLTIAGYPARGTPILGLNENDLDENGIRYATLNYAVGTEQFLDEQGQRYELEGKIEGIDDTHPSQIPGAIGVHSGDDVGVFALGPHSHLFRGVLQQHTLPHMMAYAACIGDGPTLCKDQA
ncbi:membrane-bound alkaline phosphatase-like [Calliphora vicina]|uniref:membrane-bound alkaline phosphatase-like n=1 Tax=Calliphora vicina TaxID=7373 RepID=UPI00325AAC13